MKINFTPFNRQSVFSKSAITSPVIYCFLLACCISFTAMAGGDNSPFFAKEGTTNPGVPFAVSFTVAGGGADIFSTVTTASYVSSIDATGWGYVATADLDNDGLMDVITMDRINFNQRVWLNNGSGFTEVTGAGSSNPLDGILVLDATTAGTLRNSSEHVVPGDFDGDGDTDIYDSFRGNYYINDGGSYSLATGGSDIFSAVTAASYIASIDNTSEGYVVAADLDTDGLPDLITIDRTTSNQRVWLNNGSGFTEVTGAGSGNPLNGITILDASSLFNTRAHVIAADFDADGDTDLYDSFRGYYYINSGSSYTLATGGSDIFSAVTPASYISSIDNYLNGYMFSMDLDTDGLPDMVTMDRTTYVQTVWINNGSGFTDVTGTGADPLNGIGVMDGSASNVSSSNPVVADFDGDGDPDIYDSYTGSYIIQQVAPPHITTTDPANNATNVSTEPTLTLNFDENIASAGSAVISLYRSSDDALIESFPASDSRVTVSGSQVDIDIATTLASVTGYYLAVPQRAFFDNDGMTFQGLAGTEFSFTTTGTLPLALLNFSGIWKENTARLYWATANEVNTAGVEIERSYDNADFSTVGLVPAVGYGDHTYQFEDRPDGTKPLVYYRLKLNDLDGAFTYSPVIVLRPGQAGGKRMLVFPNPATSSVVLQVQGSPATGLLQLYDQQGQKLLQQAWRPGMQVDIKALPPGVYIIHLLADDQQYRVQFTKE